MDKKFKGTQEEYLEFRRKANLRNRKYDSKPEVKARKKIYKQRYDIKNKQKISEYGIKLRSRPEYKERIKKWKEENKEHLKEYSQSPEAKVRKRKSNKKYVLKKRKDKNWLNEFLKKQQKYRDENKGIIKKYNQKYYASPKGKINYTHHNHRRLALIKERPFDLSDKKIKEIYKRDRVCVYCGNSRHLELDHIIPLKLGGNSLCNNFVLACKKCNCSKSGRDVFLWCNLQGIEVPKIVLELLEKQKQGIEIKV